MTKKDFFNKITSSWTFTYIATYGAIAFFIGLFTAVFNIFTHSFDSFSHNEFIFEFLTFALSSPITLTGLISILNLVIFIILQIIKKTYKYALVFLILLISAIIIAPYLDCSSGAGIYFLIYLFVGIPITIILFIIPTIILFLLEIFNKIPTTCQIIKSRTWAVIFVLYAILPPLFILCAILISKIID